MYVSFKCVVRQHKLKIWLWLLKEHSLWNQPLFRNICVGSLCNEKKNTPFLTSGNISFQLSDVPNSAPFQLPMVYAYRQWLRLDKQ